MERKGDYRRWLYRGGRPNWFARFQNRATAVAFAAGIMPRRAAALRIRGRRTGRVITFPVAIADYAGERYLVSMLGEDTNWVRNVRACGGHAVLRHGGPEPVILQEVDEIRRAPILRCYLQRARGARAHIPVDPRAPVEAFRPIAARYPVFRITADKAAA